MPFPLNALDYGSRRRLREELATPGEAYDLQIAAPHLDELKPLVKQPLTSDYGILSKEYGNKISLHFDGNKLRAFTRNNFSIFRRSLTVRNLSLADVQNMSYYLRLRGDSIWIYNCRITPSFLDAISFMVESCIKNLTFKECKFASSITATYLCKKFKRLKRLKFNNNCPFKRNWIDAFVDADMADLQTICFKDVPINILHIKQEKMVELFKKQINGFHLTLLLDEQTDDSEIERHKYRLFAVGFKRGDNFDSQRTAIIGIRHFFTDYEFCEHE